MTALAELQIAADPDLWRRIGLVVQDSGLAVVARVGLRFVTSDDAETRGLVGWVVAGAPDEEVDAVDGIPTAHAEPPDRVGPEHHPDLRPVGVDHVVVATSSLERTSGAIERSLGAPLKRVREAGGGVRQGFHRLGEVVVEVVESPESPDGPASLWGLVLTVEDLDEVADRLGPELLGLPRPAVQRGRFIASVRATAGVGTRLALMTPP